MYIGLHVKYPLFLSYFDETSIFAANFRKMLKFHENPTSGSWAVRCGRTDGRTDTKLKVAFRDSVNKPNNHKMTAKLQGIYIYIYIYIYN